MLLYNCVSIHQFANLAFQPYIGFGSISHLHEILFEPFPFVSLFVLYTLLLNE
jgi:hypothetical protein